MKQSSTRVLLFTCEHGGNQVPRKFAARFADHHDLLKTHRGWDPGALKTARAFAQAADVQLFFSETTRLLVDLNRSEWNPALMSSLVPPPSDKERDEILEKWYRPFRRQVLDWVTQHVQQKQQVWHLSFHSFTPELNGEVRNAEIGLLYDPQREPERALAARWKETLRETLPECRVRMNYPYRGITDGHTTTLRKSFGPGEYVGIELEVNQLLYAQSPAQVKRLIAGLEGSFLAAHQGI
ncbi:N-formylglutamate amidohydrolase [Bremerella cremea]|uniref:N-formylglutamate amidohydrolase n=1 Tax=Bremerella cremea TaxID=1031537 RepID=UPI0031EFDFCD